MVMKFLGLMNKLAKGLDQKNVSTKWGDAMVLELGQIDEYTTFIDKGHQTKVNPPSGFKKIRVHLVFSMTADIRPDWSHMDISQTSQLIPYIQES
jgi:hypothetical protein